MNLAQHLKEKLTVNVSEESGYPLNIDDVDWFVVSFIEEDSKQAAVPIDKIAEDFAKVLNELGRDNIRFIRMSEETRLCGYRQVNIEYDGVIVRQTSTYTLGSWTRCPDHEIRLDCEEAGCDFKPEMIHDSGVQHTFDIMVRK